MYSEQFGMHSKRCVKVPSALEPMWQNKPLIGQTIWRCRKLCTMSNLLWPLTNWRPICFAQWPIFDEVYRIVLFNDELPNVPPNSYGTLAERKREKVYLHTCALCRGIICLSGALHPAQIDQPGADLTSGRLGFCWNCSYSIVWYSDALTNYHSILTFLVYLPIACVKERFATKTKFWNWNIWVIAIYFIIIF